MPTDQCGTRIEDVTSTHYHDNGDTQSVAGSPGRRLTAHATYLSTASVMSEPRQKKMGRKIGADLVGGSSARAAEGADDEEQPAEGEGAPARCSPRTSQDYGAPEAMD